MAALLVAIALMSVFMSAAMPVWRHAAQREKEAELLWRGRQYDRALQLYRRKYSTPGPPSVDVLVEERFLRKKYKDPIAGADFELRPVSPMGNMPDAGEVQSRPSRRAAGRRRETASPEHRKGQLIGGVRSRSRDRSILILNGRQRYNEWEFAYVPYQDARSQAAAEGQSTPGRRPGLSSRGRGQGSGRATNPRTRGTGSRGSAPRSSTTGSGQQR